MTRQLQRALRTTTNPVPAFTMGPQRQWFAPVVHSAVAPITSLASGIVRMPGGHHALPHVHVDSEIMIFVVSGMAASLVGHQLDEVFFHAPGSVMYIGPGVPHVGVNLSHDIEVEVFEVRTDRAFNDDVVRLPELDQIAAHRSAQLRSEVTLGHFDEQLRVPVVSTALWERGSDDVD